MAARRLGRGRAVNDALGADRIDTVRRSPGGAQRRRLDSARWHFQHGPIDCVVGVEGDAAAVARALDDAWRRFETLLAKLVAELPLLRADLASPGGAAVAPRGVVARRMVEACRPHARGGRFVTAMAAVAGSVADELIAGFDRPGIARASVNNGGDIALYLAAGSSYDVGLVADTSRARCGLPPEARFRVDAASGVRGIATSGWRGRSFSLGIADSVTVLAATASAADAAATMIANAVDADHPGIRRQPACELRDDTDLGARLVTVAVPALPPEVVERALAAGLAEAHAQLGAGRIAAVALCLQGRMRRCAHGSAFDTLAARPQSIAPAFS